MKHFLIKANSKKLKWFNTKQHKNTDTGSSSGSNSELSSEDETTLPENENMIYEYINNRYLCIKYLGRGAFARVWCVLDIIDDKYYAMKVFFKEYREDSFEEIKVYKKISSKSATLNLYDSFLYKNQMCLIIDLMGYTLLDFVNYCFDENNKIDTNKSVYIDIVRKITKYIMISLKDIHDEGFIHSDLKLENIMFDNHHYIIKKYYDMELKKTYDELITRNLPDNYSSLEKSKKKNIKRKIRTRCINLLVERIKSVKELENDENYRQLYFQSILDNNNFNVKIVDYGNIIHIDEKETEEIMTRPYRPPENILTNNYDKKADIWCVGCLLFELLTNDYIFDIDKDLDNSKRDIDHLRKMTMYIGKIPKKICEDSVYFKQIKKFKEIETMPIHIILIKDYEFSKEDAEEIECFIKKLLTYELEERYCVDLAISDKWCR